MQMWLEAIAIALPRVQDHFEVSDSRIGWLSTSMFGGMMFGAVGWGNCKYYIWWICLAFAFLRNRFRRARKTLCLQCNAGSIIHIWISREHRSNVLFPLLFVVPAWDSCRRT